MYLHLLRVQRWLIITCAAVIIGMVMFQDDVWLQAVTHAVPRLVFVVFLLIGGAYGVAFSVVTNVLNHVRLTEMPLEGGQRVRPTPKTKGDLYKIIAAGAPVAAFYTLILGWFVANEFNTINGAPNTQITFNTFLPFLLSLGWGFGVGEIAVRVVTAYREINTPATDDRA